MTETRWIRSSRCEGGACLEVAAGGAVHVRDSKHPDGPVLTFSHAEWAAFLAGVQAGEFDVAGGGA